MEIFDSTLRDGEQAAGVYLSPEEKASYAKLLEISGVDIIDSGFPFASKTDWEGVRSIAAATKKKVADEISDGTSISVAKSRPWPTMEQVSTVRSTA